MQRAILLQTAATRRKATILEESTGEALSLANYLLRRRKARRLMDLHRELYSACKVTTCFNSQVICDIERSVARSKGKAAKAITTRFNVPRNCKTFNTNLAKSFDADIAVEGLRRFSPKSRKYNREALRMPFDIFGRNLAGRCFDKGINLEVEDAYHTSKWCSHCGAVAASGHSSKNYALFKCLRCGQVVNSDRKASLAAAVKSLLVRKKNEQALGRWDFFQFTGRPVPINGLLRSDDGTGFGAVHLEPTPMESHLFQQK